MVSQLPGRHHLSQQAWIKQQTTLARFEKFEKQTL
jgi:hypothetical protein